MAEKFFTATLNKINDFRFWLVWHPYWLADCKVPKNSMPSSPGLLICSLFCLAKSIPFLQSYSKDHAFSFASAYDKNYSPTKIWFLMKKMFPFFNLLEFTLPLMTNTRFLLFYALIHLKLNISRWPFPQISPTGPFRNFPGKSGPFRKIGPFRKGFLASWKFAKWVHWLYSKMEVRTVWDQNFASFPILKCEVAYSIDILNNV